MNKLAIEIGCEEMPAKLILPAIQHLKTGLCKALSDCGIKFEEPKTIATARRLGLYFDSVETEGPSSEKQEKGPPKNLCFQNDQPTKALLGFAQKVNIKPEEVQFANIGGTDYASATVKIEGRKLSDIVAVDLPKIVLSFPHPHSMRWDETGVSWVRPIRWIVALQDDKILPCQIASTVSGNATKTPRSKKTADIEIKSASTYLQTLKDIGVSGNYEERMGFIFDQATSQAQSAGLKAVKNDSLLEELAGIVERPLVITGEFSQEYIDSTPDLVLRSVLVSDLRFIPFEKDGKLSNKFGLVVNGTEDVAPLAMAGELKVLMGRLSDAKFFFAEDRKHSLNDFAAKLSGIAFMKNLGTLANKTDRMVKIAQSLDFGVDKTSLSKALSLAKADLATSVVREHDDLQGQIGGLYASLDGQNADVSSAIAQQYKPAGESDEIPSTRLGQAVSLIDKADSFVNLVSSGNLPKSSADPLGVRRFAFGLLRILLEGEVSVDLSKLLEVCESFTVKRNPKAVEEGLDFLKARLENLLKSKGYRYDAVRASLSRGLTDLKVTLERVQAIQEKYSDAKFAGIVATTKRLNNILKDWKTCEFDDKLFVEDVEKRFADFAKNISEELKSTKTSLSELETISKLTDPAEEYFNNIMVNADDEKIRTNRKNFLSWLLTQIRGVADFVEIAI
ncbi:MAG: glycine--tRNA ligase subunit beta [Caldisericia bacterium]|nr:glycine--tRNA ligase subunit beta [Caldisericia bacterium]